ncbi:MAG: orotate phosphoribosyltransferase [Elusimicrobiales bacterium]|nr:orotate phosphoribosyltransferase [Elusimicrobiales bacterium]
MKKDLLAALKENGALLTGHFLLSSGLHSPDYVQCALALKSPARAREYGRGLAALWSGPRPDAVLSPAMGGLIIGHETAAALGVDFLFAERQEGKLTLRRGFSLPRGSSVVIVEDVFTTGKSTMETAELAGGLGAKVLGALSMIDRTGGLSFPFPSASLLRLGLTVYDPSDCPLCATGAALVKPGSREGGVKNAR